MRADTKHETIGKSSSDKAIRLAQKSTRYYQHKSDKEMSSFVTGLPYGYDTAFGYTTLIDPKLTMRKMAKECYSTTMDHQHFGMNQAEMNTIDCLIEGKIISKLAFPRVDE